MSKPRIALPEPTSTDAAYNQRSWPQYAHALESIGAIAVPVPLSESQATIARLASTCSGILLPGSPADVNPQKYGQEPIPECAPSDPAREAVDELLLQDAFNLHKPILGICYGLQALNVWRNGTLIQHLTPGNGTANHDPGREVQDAHPLAVAISSRLAAILYEASDVHRDPNDPDALELETNSSHHQAVDAPGDGLAIAARCAADGVIEALEGRTADHFVLGVQWHPERSFGLSPASRAIFRTFVAAAGAWRAQPIQESLAARSER